MHLLITGAAGFIGSALTRALRTAGHTVTAVDDLSVESPRARPDGLQVRDVRSLTPHDLDGADTVVHLAAHKSVPASFLTDAFEHNTAADAHLIRAFARSTARRLLLASSCEVYGQHAGPLPETAARAPRSPYATGKAATEHLAEVYRPLLGPGRQIAVARLFNTFGPDEGADAVVPAFLDAAADDGELTMEGDGGQARDLTHIDDMTAMLTRILARRDLLPIVNCGSGRACTILELARSVIRVAGGGRVRRVPARPNEIRSFTADTTLFADVYGLLPHRPLAAALADTLRQRRPQHCTSTGAPR
ncbi:NAD(P)-dependent oxidoreductase [Amycolatopsis sp. NPDC004079]|uniref:NAD-dependent epimerase/dehydratase family protein n=1 Tax=Amycolatopsis sp. NPDC004079 TaxID=3154549 RepID=UPI0033BCBDFD